MNYEELSTPPTGLTPLNFFDTPTPSPTGGGGIDRVYAILSYCIISLHYYTFEYSAATHP